MHPLAYISNPGSNDGWSNGGSGGFQSRSSAAGPKNTQKAVIGKSTNTVSIFRGRGDMNVVTSRNARPPASYVVRLVKGPTTW